ncbi:MAG: hypothetical protein JKY43_07160 [Phycisphaerales bacterium]|nr:hypothetical protein [Phycisphaerales bacterium]
MPVQRPNKQRLLFAPSLLALSVCGIVLLGFTASEQSHQPAGSDLGSQSEDSAKDSGVQECVLTFSTGRKITGIMMESNDENVVLRINGIDTTYRRTRIDSIKFLAPVSERFKEFRSAIPDSDIDSRLLLVDWLRDRRAYELAIEELDSILETEPTNPQAKILKTWLEQHLKLAQNRVERKKSSERIRNLRRSQSNIPTLTKEQINLIRIYEIDLTNPPRFKIHDETIKELMHRSPESFPVDERQRKAILDGSDLDKLKLLFRHKARDLYPQIQILEDPASFQDFKKNVLGQSGWVINGCATARCHGGSDAGQFRLTSHNPNSSESMYSNFLVLEQFELRNGTPLINYTDPERSPLVHMGMVRSRSLYPHPTVDAVKFGRKWRPVFRTTTAMNFKRTIEWIRSLYTPRPDYGFEYPPEGEINLDSGSSSPDP